MADIASLGFAVESKELEKADKLLGQDLPASAEKTEKAADKVTKSLNEVAGAAGKVANDTNLTAKALSAADAVYKSAASSAFTLSKNNAAVLASNMKLANSNDAVTKSVANLAAAEAKAASDRKRNAIYNLPKGGWGSPPPTTPTPPAGGGGSNVVYPRLNGVTRDATQAAEAISMTEGAALAAAARMVMLAGAIAGVAVVYGTLVVKIAALSDAHEIELRRLQSLTGARSEAVGYYSDIAKFASDAGISIAAATERAVTFARAGSSLGQTARSMLSVASTVEKLSQLGGATSGESSAAQGAIAKMLTESKVSAAELRTILANVPGIADAIARGLGVSKNNLQLMVEEGRVSGQMVFDALLKQQDEVNKKFAAMPKSTAAVFEGIKNNATELIQRYSHLVPLVNEYQLAVWGLSKALEAVNRWTTPGLNPNASDVSNNVNAEIARTELMGKQILEAAKLANSLDPIETKFRQLSEQERIFTEGLSALNSGLSNLPAEEVANRIYQFEEGLRKTRVEMESVASDYEKMWRKLTLIDSQNASGMNALQKAMEARSKALVDTGGAPSKAAADALVDRAQVQTVLEMVEAKELEAQKQELLAAAVGKGAAAMREATIAAAMLDWQMKNVGASTEDAQGAMDILVERYDRAMQRIGAAGAKISAGRGAASAGAGLQEELNGIAAAMSKVEQGAFAMNRAMAEAKHGKTGDMNLRVFDARQALTDATALNNLKLETELTNKLAGAAGQVAEQKRIQLDYDIRRAQMNVGTAAAPAIAEAMELKAKADATKAAADATADFANRSRDFVAAQEIERNSLFMGKEAANAYAIALEEINRQKRAGVELTPEQVASIHEGAAAMAAAQAKTEEYTKVVNAGKEVTKGFASELMNGLREGKDAWTSLADAAETALGRIADKLMDFALDGAFDALLGKGGGGGSGGLGGLLGNLFGGGASGTASGIFDSFMGSSFFPVMKNGGAINAGRVVPFARGGIVNKPTMFPMANGAGLMGEAGPEGILPLKRGPDGRLGVSAHGGNRNNAERPIVIQVAADSQWITATAQQSSAETVRAMTPSIVGQSVEKANKQVVSTVDNHKATRGGDHRMD